jgi:transcriptional regulator with PAS, ATPase and Fis domain
MQRIFSLLPEIADSECTVLIQGPSGSGKELIAQAIHNLSPRKDNPYIKINCAALPENLLESELFGYVKGAFTDAKRDKPGQFLLAHGGSLLLDEIAEMPLPLQAKLLRVLNNGEFHPLGSTVSYQSDARIITATNRNLEELVRTGKFREDLYYRINVIAVHVPPLKERLEDLPILIEYFISKFSAKRGKAIQGMSPQALQLLRKYDFPGNIRELENAIEHAFVLCSSDTIEVCHLPPKIIQSVAEKESKDHGSGLSERSEEAIIREALIRNLGNRDRTAQELGLHRTTLWRKIKKYNLEASQ